MRVLELGNYVAPAYAGMVLAEQGHEVVKAVKPGADPILSLKRGEELWEWINHRKTLVERHPRDLMFDLAGYDAVIENFRPTTLEKWGIDPDGFAHVAGVPWVSLWPEVGERSFDLVAQARSTLEYAPWAPYYLGDTAAGLWMAFKALSAHERGEAGHHVLGHASVLQKLVEGELVIDVERSGGAIPWDEEEYRFDADASEARITYKGESLTEPIRDREWKLENLLHDGGRIRV